MSDFNLTFPIDMALIKKEQRIVVGIATADNIDKSGDVVTFEASEEAFKNWEGNIREMHAPIAVGKAISYKPVVIKGQDGQEYKAFQVEAYISKGAQNTWEKILDGTLRAFSIGGKIIEKEAMSNKIYNGKPIRKITKYSLGELSLVDNPANAIATIDIIKRAEDGDLKYVLDEDIEKAKQPLKDPKGGLTAAGRRHFKQTEGANLKPGVKGPANTPEKMRRKGSFLTRFFTNPSGPMKDDKGRPTRLALSAAAWGEPVPQNMQDAAALAAKGRRLLERYANVKKQSVEKILEEDNEILNKEMQYFLDEDMEVLENMDDNKKDVENTTSLLQNDVKYDNVKPMENDLTDNRLSLLKRFVNWLVPEDDQSVELDKFADSTQVASTEVEVNIDQAEEEMDINILKDALGSVIDQKLNDFATSLKEEVEASVNAKIDEVTKAFEADKAALSEKLEQTEKALTEQSEQVKVFADAGAVKKSVDPEDDEDEDGEEIRKSAPETSFWNNIYLPKGLINALGYKS
jgi:hypothetical protein